MARNAAYLARKAARRAEKMRAEGREAGGHRSMPCLACGDPCTCTLCGDWCKCSPNPPALAFQFLHDYPGLAAKEGETPCTKPIE